MNRLIQSALFAFCLCFSVKSVAQDSQLDSLKLLLKKAANDTNKLALLEAISDAAPDGEWQVYSDELGRLSQKFISHKDPAIQKAGKRYYSVSLNNKGFIALEKGDYNTALDFYEQSLRISKEIGDKKM